MCRVWYDARLPQLPSLVVPSLHVDLLPRILHCTSARGSASGGTSGSTNKHLGVRQGCGVLQSRYLSKCSFEYGSALEDA